MTREEPLILERDGRRLFAVRHHPATLAPAPLPSDRMSRSSFAR